MLIVKNVTTVSTHCHYCNFVVIFFFTEYANDESHQQELEEGLPSRSCDLDTKSIFNRQGVAKPVLQTPPSLINYL